MKCPICGNFSKVKYKLDEEFIKKRLSNHFQSEIPESVEILEYSLMECSNCSFEFANPLIEGSESFYNWVTSQDNYYPANRWEHSKVAEIIEDVPNLNILDIGCGDGIFFDVLKKKKKTGNFTGVDLTHTSIQECLRKGYESHCMTVSEFKEKNPHSYFNYVVSFHCLEHIANPLKFMKALISLLAPNGFIFISTPYSPMTIELKWFDILNNPPHHMGRWNSKAYEELASQLNLNIEFIAQRNSTFGFVNDSIESFTIANKNIIYSRIKNKKTVFMKLALLRPFNFVYHLFKQFFRDKLINQRAPNVVLVKFSKK
jgi:2-polyprenyl-3-methyl-5-hydroxy-6-metoxy-1,4-benzoquinol methylase